MLTGAPASQPEERDLVGDGSAKRWRLFALACVAFVAAGLIGLAPLGNVLQKQGKAAFVSEMSNYYGVALLFLTIVQTMILASAAAAPSRIRSGFRRGITALILLGALGAAQMVHWNRSLVFSYVCFAIGSVFVSAADATLPDEPSPAEKGQERLRVQARPAEAHAQHVLESTDGSQELEFLHAKALAYEALVLLSKAERESVANNRLAAGLLIDGANSTALRALQTLDDERRENSAQLVAPFPLEQDRAVVVAADDRSWPRVVGYLLGAVGVLWLISRTRTA